MVNDGGGWMLVTADMIQSEALTRTTATKTADSNGGLIVFIQRTGVAGCNGVKSYQVLFKDIIPWTKIRSDYEFYNGNSCWGIFGNASYIGSNLVTYQAGTDTIRNQVRMGGSNGSNFDGTTARCDNETVNFWHSNQGTATRSAQVILRRNSMSSYAGLSTGTECSSGTDGWKYKNIYIR